MIRKILQSHQPAIINSESGQEEFSTVPTRRHFFSRKKGIEEAIEKLNEIGTDFYINESYFLYDRSGFIKQAFITALNKTISIYGSVSYFNKKTKNDIIKIINPQKFLKFYVKKDTLKDSLSLQLTNVSGKIPQLRDSKIYNFSLSRIEKKKRKRQLPEPTESVIIHAKQNFDVDGGLNPVKIELEDDRIINIPKKHKNARDRLTALGFLIPSSVKNDTEQIFITWRELNDVNKSLINGKIYELVEIIDLNKINNWKE